ncbi:MAG TPA: homoserine kinase [Vicinamibacteria bacterium]
MSAARGFAPGTIGNVGPGLDVLGLAVTGPGDAVVAEATETPGVTIRDPGHPTLPADAHRHTAGIAAAEVLRRAGSDRGVALRVEKGLPLGGGCGGSAASAVAAAVAVNALIGAALPSSELLLAGLAAEEAVSGRHLDNVAPALLGGLVLVLGLEPPDVVPLAVPAGLRVVLAEPRQVLRTADARAVLPREVPLATAMAQAARVAALVTALARGDDALLARALDDRIAEPARAPLLPGFLEARRAAREAGALGASLSGSGPTAFALAPDEATAGRVAAAMAAAYRARGVECRTRVERVDERGARVEQSALR